MSSYRFYNSYLDRILVVGRPMQSQVAFYKAIMIAFSKADYLVKPGLNTKEIFSAIQQTIAQVGVMLAKCIFHLLS